MADEKKFVYGGIILPHRESNYRVLRWGWKGLNRKSEIDTGQITDCEGVRIDPPYVVPFPAFSVYDEYEEPIGLFAFDDFLLVIYRDNEKIMVDWRRGGNVYSGALGEATGTDADFEKRSVVQFNVASNTENIIEATFVRKLLIFPDKYSMDFEVTADFTPAYLGNTYPDLKYATVYGSRVFGVGENLVFASSFNDYADWDLDTADNYSDANAWVSMSQSNVHADGEFTGIYTFDNHVVLFKKDFTQLVYNNKNPFRIVDVTGYGADNPYSITETEGALFFAAKDGVYAFTGGIPENVGEVLDLPDFTESRMGTWKKRSYLSVGKDIYSLESGVWSKSQVESEVMQFATNTNGLYALLKNGKILQIDGVGMDGNSASYGDWWFDTDLIMAGNLNVRRAKKFTLYCDMEAGSSVSVSIKTSLGHEFVPLVKSFGAGEKMISAALRGFAGYGHKLRIRGHGRVKIYAAELQIAWGGDVYGEIVG